MKKQLHKVGMDKSDWFLLLTEKNQQLETHLPIILGYVDWLDCIQCVNIPAINLDDSCQNKTTQTS